LLASADLEDVGDPNLLLLLSAAGGWEEEEGEGLVPVVEDVVLLVWNILLVS